MTYAGAGYPRPPPNNPFASNAYPADEGPRTSTNCRRFILCVLSVFVIFGAIVLIVWLVLRPQLPEFSVTTVTVPAFNSTSINQLKASWDVTFTAYNRNKKMSIQYEDVLAALSYLSEPLATTPLSPFHQETRNTTTLAVHLASDSYVSNFAYAKLKSDRRAGNVEFDFGLLAAVQFRSGVWRTKWRSLRVYCYEVEINFLTNTTSGNLKSSPSHCAVLW